MKDTNINNTHNLDKLINDDHLLAKAQMEVKLIYFLSLSFPF